jgi:hypothetical protein
MSSADVNIDAAIAQFGALRYPLASSSYYRTADTFKEVATIWRSGAFAILGLVLGVWFMLGRDLLVANERFIFFGVLIALAVAADELPKRKVYTYMLYIGTAGGEQIAFSTHDDAEMKSIEQLLRIAISTLGLGIEVGYETSKT